MKKTKNIILAVIMAMLGGGGYAAYDTLSNGATFGGSAPYNYPISNLISYATSTGSYDLSPVLVLKKDADRRYARFQNNSAVDVWLFATSTDLDLTGTGQPRAATTSITVLNGVLLEAKKAGGPVATWELDYTNMVYGNIYASSTAATEIQVNYQ